MINTLTQQDNNTLVLGLGVSGLSCLEYFSQCSSAEKVYAYDDSFEDNPEELVSLQNKYKEIEFIENKSIIPFYAIDKCVATPGIADSHTVVKRFLDSKKPVICDVEIFSQHNHLPTIAITGTNGKSTVVSWLAHVLNALGKQTLLAGNIGTPVLDFLNGKQASLDSYDVVVLELSSFQLERVNSLTNHIALLLNLSPDHMDRYLSLEKYKAAKERIFNHSKVVVINKEANNFAFPKRVEKITFNSQGNADITISKLNGRRYIVSGQEQLLAVEDLALIGEHNVSNALAVLACCKALEINLNRAAEHLVTFSGLPHRSEFVASLNGIAYINDSKATNADATVAAVSGDISSLILIVGGDSKQADLSVLPLALENKVKHIFALGKDASVFVELLSSVSQVERVKSLEMAVRRASEIAVTGDTVLLSPACSSLDMFKNYIERGNQFKALVHAMEVAA